MSARRGVGLAEVLVTVALAGVVMAAASHGLAQHLRLRRARDATARADEIVREVHVILRAELGHAAGQIRVLGDTAVDLPSLRVLSRACEVSSTRLILSSSTSWWAAPRPGDSLAVLDTLTRTEWRTSVVAVGSQRASAACPDGGTKLTLSAAPPPTVPALLLPARIWRMMRYAAYRAADGTWWFGERNCVSSCGAVQPIAGPLLPPAQGGLRLSVVLDAHGRPRALDVSVRAAVSGRSARLSARVPLADTP